MTRSEFVRGLPKVELHDHLDGGLRPATVIELAADCGLCLHTQDPAEIGAWFRRGADRRSLPLYLEGFSTTCAVMQSEAALERVAREAALDLAADGVVYAEVRFAPILHTERGLDLESIVLAVAKGLAAGSEPSGMRWGIIICALRNMDARLSLEAAELAIAFRDRGVVGFDIAGDEHGHPPKRHLEAFQLIRNRNFNITIHAGEAFGPESIWQAIQICGAQRIGHGTRLIEDMAVEGRRITKMGSLASYVRDRRIPLECCLSSNIQTGAAGSIEGHPFGILYRNNFRVALCTDNRLMSDTTVSREMELAVDAFGLSLADLEKLTVNAMKSAFIGYDDRVKIIYDLIKPGYAAARALKDKPLA
jgi:adenosine deaminase